ncbi:MAG TPA: OmpA family protein [Bryobacteraceae bacterium]|nr:OmpA family protein [Bryobacteraceae bacterium]
MRKSRTFAIGTAGILLLASSIACQKKTAVLVPVPPKVEAAEPVKPNPPVIVSFAVEPATIDRGQSATLHWKVTDATRIEIDHGIGVVAASAEHRVAPDDPVTYRLIATGPGGEASATTTLQVNLPPPPPQPAPVTPPTTITERLANEVRDVYFDFDHSDLRPDARAALTGNAAALKSILADFPSTTVVLEGHCDERGSAEYNIALGDRRGAAVKAFLSDLGLTERLLVISYGKERPQCTEANEECWQKNRRVHFSPGEDQVKHVLHGAE